MGPRLMARRTMAERKRRAAARDQARTELEHLLARLDRHTLLDTERPLLRTHVEQLLATDAELRRTIAGQQTLVQRLGRQLDAAHDAIREAEQQAADTAEQLRAYRAVEEQRQADRVTRRPSLAEWWTATAAERRATHIRAFLDEQTAHLTPSTPEQP
ncbi:hypothetical protein OG909_12145 [Streptomyces sp. NBC_01754]|uniref:hypothetical protein n=1 Tax=Streptomyces sp. NBC_01754 TaxID=2975930 RepID=UPI002DDC71C7|nr:hypothetical protein [Streptomyces sp. NBC_01754]WSC92985.1 hypothetical protein OG909_12145 [Streptomyces sp. NBC_01754]